MPERAVYSETQQDFVIQPEIPVLLTYRADGEPIVVMTGKKRERVQDMDRLHAWLTAMFKRTDAPAAPGETTGGAQ